MQSQIEGKERMELDNFNKMKEEPHPSNAYIRGLVTQLSTSRTKEDSMNPRDSSVCVVDGDVSSGRNSKKRGKLLDASTSQTQQPQQHKKQVRRRLHTSRPYQERLLNMAEARREIVTALKFHRASMKQASEQQQQQQAQEQKQQPSISFHPSLHPTFEQDSWRNFRIHPLCSTNFSNCMDDFSNSYFSHPPSFVPNSYNLPPLTKQDDFSPIAPPFVAENPNFMLPNQTLGLNLNFHEFNNLDATLHRNNNNSSSLCSYSSPTSSPSLSAVTADQEVPSVGMSRGDGTCCSLVDTIESSDASATQFRGGFHTTMDDEGMAEIRSLGEQYQLEWNDTMNLVISACWFKFLKNMEHNKPSESNAEDHSSYQVFDGLVEFPAWLDANEGCLEQQCSEDYFQDPTLPCMDIGDIEGMGEEWLA